MARMFLKPTDQVLHYIAISEHRPRIGSEDIWGGVHRLLGQITHKDLACRYAAFVDEAGVDLSDFPDGAFWIVNEDCNGVVSAAPYSDEESYRNTVEDFTSRWEKVVDSL